MLIAREETYYTDDRFHRACWIGPDCRWLLIAESGDRPGLWYACISSPVYYTDPALGQLARHCPDWAPVLDWLMENAVTPEQQELARSLEQLLQTAADSN